MPPPCGRRQTTPGPRLALGRVTKQGLVHAEPMVAESPLIDLDRPSPAARDGDAVVRSRPALALIVLVTVLLAVGGSAPARPGLTPVLALDEPVTAAELSAGSLFL